MVLWIILTLASWLRKGIEANYSSVVVAPANMEASVGKIVGLALNMINSW